MPDFQDITPVVVCVETDKGALEALIDDPILLVQHDASAYYATAKMRGIEALRQARDDSSEFVPLISAALLIDCPTCHAEVADPCFSDDGRSIVPVHDERIKAARAGVTQAESEYMNRGVKVDG